MRNKDYMASIDEPEDSTPCFCGLCGWTGTYDRVTTIEDCCLTPGDPSPAGRCPIPDCGALAYVEVKTSGDEELKSEIADFLAEMVDCYSRNGEFNNLTAPMSTSEIRERATELAKRLGVQFSNGVMRATVTMITSQPHTKQAK